MTHFEDFAVDGVDGVVEFAQEVELAVEEELAALVEFLGFEAFLFDFLALLLEFFELGLGHLELAIVFGTGGGARFGCRLANAEVLFAGRGRHDRGKSPSSLAKS